MRMRRTAFIMALMTVFTVSLFAQNSRGRNYIKQNISEWGGCRNVAITDTGGDLALNGKNDYAYTAGIPQALADALEKYHDDDDYIDDVQLTEDGEWLILVGKNGCQWSNIPSELESKLRQWNEAEETITSVTFNATETGLPSPPTTSPLPARIWTTGSRKASRLTDSCGLLT